MSKRGDETSADDCPKCGALSYRGGYCFRCGTYRPSKRSDTTEVDGLDSVEFMYRGFGTRLSDLGAMEEDVDEAIRLRDMHERHSRVRKRPKMRSVVELIEEACQIPLVVQAVIQPYDKTSEGELVRALEFPWTAVVERLKDNWNDAYGIAPRIWEEIVAGAFDRAGYDHVTLTPRSGDLGRDVIAVKNGIGAIRIIDSVKAYRPGHLVKHDDVRALVGVLYADSEASKAILTTTSDFAPGIDSDSLLRPLMPFRLELMNGARLKAWLEGLVTK